MGWEGGGSAHRLVDQRVARVAAVVGLRLAASAAAVQHHAAGEVELTGGFWVLFGDLDAHLSGLAGGPLDLLHDDCETCGMKAWMETTS